MYWATPMIGISFQPLSSLAKHYAVCAFSAQIKCNYFLIIGTRQQLSKVDISFVKVGSSGIIPLTRVRNLGALSTIKMSKNQHISKAFRGLYNIRQIRKLLLPKTCSMHLFHFIWTTAIRYYLVFLHSSKNVKYPPRLTDRALSIYHTS